MRADDLSDQTWFHPLKTTPRPCKPEGELSADFEVGMALRTPETTSPLMSVGCGSSVHEFKG